MFHAVYLSKEKDQFQAKLAALDDAQLLNEELSPGDVTLLEIPGMPHHLLNCSCAEAVAGRIAEWMAERCAVKLPT